MFQRGTSRDPNRKVSTTSDIAGLTGTIHSRCAMYSLRQSFWIVPPSRAKGMPRLSAAARYIAHTIEAGPLIVIDVVTSSRGIRSKRISMSRSVSTATPSRPTSPRESGSSLSRPISVGMSNATDRPLTPCDSR